MSSHVAVSGLTNDTLVVPTRLARTASWFGLCAVSVALLGCGDAGDLEPMRPRAVSAQQSPSITTVINVSWNTDGTSIGYVEYGPTPELAYSTALETEEAEQHAVSLLGLSPDTQYYYRIVTWGGGDAGASQVGTISTGSLPAELPQVQATGEGHDRYTVVPFVGEPSVVTIIDPQGQIVWAHTDRSGLRVTRALIAADGDTVIYNTTDVGGPREAESALVKITIDGTSVTPIPIPGLAEDFVEHRDGTLAALVLETRDVDGTPLRGNKIVEIDPAGMMTDVWSTWDCFDPAAWPGDDPERAWTSATALDFNSNEQAYYVSLRNLSSIAKVDRASGTCDWILGSSAATLAFAGGAEAFLHQNQFQVADGNVLVMDNDGLGGTSRVLEYALDLEAMTATQIWSHVSESNVYTPELGEPTRIPGGDTFINWSSSGLMERVDADGVRVWSLTAPGAVFGYHTLATRLYSAASRSP